MIKKETLQFAADLMIASLQDTKDPTKKEFTQTSYRDDDTAYLVFNCGTTSVRIAHRGKDVAKIPEAGTVQPLPYLSFFADPEEQKKLERCENGCYAVKNPDENSYAPCKQCLFTGSFDVADYMKHIRELYATQTTKLPAYDLESMTRLATDGKILYLIRDDQTAVWKRITEDCGRHFHKLLPGMLACAKKDVDGCFFGISLFLSIPVLRLCWPNRNIDAAIALGYPKSLPEFVFYTENCEYRLTGIKQYKYSNITETERKETTMAKSEMDASLQALQALQSSQKAVQQIAGAAEPSAEVPNTFVSPALAQKVASQVLPKQNIGNIPLQRQAMTQVPVAESPASADPVISEHTKTLEPVSVPTQVAVAQSQPQAADHSEDYIKVQDAVVVTQKTAPVQQDRPTMENPVHAPSNIRTAKEKPNTADAASVGESEAAVVTEKIQAVLDKSDAGDVQSVGELLDVLLRSIQVHLDSTKAQLKLVKLLQKQYKAEQKNNPSWKDKYEELQKTFNAVKSLFTKG